MDIAGCREIEMYVNIMLMSIWYEIGGLNDIAIFQYVGVMAAAAGENIIWCWNEKKMFNSIG